MFPKYLYHRSKPAKQVAMHKFVLRFIEKLIEQLIGKNEWDYTIAGVLHLSSWSCPSCLL